jgi:branched-chain amino acid transport system substrate-binding protein
MSFRRVSMRQGRSVAGILLVATLTAVGCSSSKKSTNANTATSAGSSSGSTVAAPTKSPLTIGVITSITGVGGTSEKYSATTAQGWANWVNSAMGGINGHPVKLIAKDDKSDPATVLSVAKELVETDKVSLIVSADATADIAGGAYLSQSNVPVVGFGYLPTVWNKAPNYFSSSAVIPVLNQIQPVTVKAVGATAFADAACAEVTSCSSAAPFYKPAADSVGVKYNGLLTASSSAPSYTAECLKFIQQGTDYIEATFASAAIVHMANDCYAQGYKGWFGVAAGSTVASAFQSVNNLKLAGSMFAFPWYATAAPVKTFTDAMAKYNSGNDYKDANSTAVWSALELFRKAAANVSDDVSAQSVMSALGNNVKNETLGGLLAQPITFTAGQPSPPVKCEFMYKLEGGKFQTVTTGTSGNGQSGDLQSSCYPPK